MKKLLCILMSLCMLFALAACGSSKNVATATDEPVTVPPATDAAADAPTEASSEAPAASSTSILDGAELPHFKICLVYTTFTDKLGSQMKNSIQYLADAFNVEVVYQECPNGMSSDEKLATLQNVAESGVDGFIVVGVSPAQLAAVNGLPYVCVQAEPTTEGQAQECASVENYLGAICENDYLSGYRAAESLYAQGARNFCLSGITKGVSRTHDERSLGFRNFLDEHDDCKLLAEDYSAAQWGDAISAFAASYPQMDGLYVTGGGEVVYQTMKTEGLGGYVKLACFNVSESTGDYIESGDLSWIAGGQYGTTQIGFAVLYNYLIDKTRIIEDTATTLYRPFLTIANMDEYNTYIKYVDSGTPVYTADEIANMIHYFNPDANYAMYEEIANSYSISDIYARHQSLLG